MKRWIVLATALMLLGTITGCGSNHVQETLSTNDSTVENKNIDVSKNSQDQEHDYDIVYDESLSDTESYENEYVPGVYTSTITLNNNTMNVNVTVDERHIKDISLDILDETSSETLYPLIQPALENITKQIYETQSTDNIIYEEAKEYTSVALLNAIKDALSKASGTDEIDDSGEKVLTSTNVSNADFALEAKINREQIRQQNKEDLMDVINSTALSDQEKQDAVDKMIALTDIAQKESDAEMLLEAKGFTDVVVSITEDAADVILNMGDVTDAKCAQIEDIVKRKTHISSENITITPIETNSKN